VGAIGVDVAIAPATGDCTLPRGGGLAAGARAGSRGGGVRSRGGGDAGRGDSAAFGASTGFGASAGLAAGFGGSGARAGGGAAAVGAAFGAGAAGCAFGGESFAVPSSPRLRSREKMLMLPPDADTHHRPLARNTLGRKLGRAVRSARGGK
jgi:hypothetical protein